MSRKHVITLAGLNFVPDHSGALFLPQENMLLVADLHLEQGASLARRGLHVPPYDTQATLAMLEQVLVQTGARKLVLLGDSFHDCSAHEEIAPAELQRLMALTARVETFWIAGNHDPHAPQSLGGSCIEQMNLGAIILRHIPGRLRKAEFEIAGHLHPGAALVQRGHRVHTKCFAVDDRRIILPAFGTYTGALNIQSQAYRGLLNPEKTHAYMISASAIHRFPYSRLG